MLPWDVSREHGAMLCAISSFHVLQRFWLLTLTVLVLVLVGRLIAARPRAGWLAWADAFVVIALAAFTGIGYLAEAPTPTTNEAATPALLSATQIALGAFVQVQLGFCLVAYLGITKRRPISFLGLGQQGPWRVLGQAVVGLIVALIVMNAVDFALHHWVLHSAAPEQSDQAIVQTFLQTGSRATQIVLIVSACVVAPLMEELMYRGMIFGLARSIIGARLAAIFGASVFALAHADAVAALPLFLLALAFTIMYVRTGSLLVPVAMHALFNALNLWEMSH